MVSTISRRKKRLAIAGAVVLTFSGAGAAFAYWSSTGSGTGAATTGSNTAFTVAAATAVGTISPGGAGQTVNFTVTNPGPGTQQLTNVAVTMAGPTGTAWAPTGGCLIGDYTATVTTQPVSSPTVLAAGATTGNGVVTVTLASSSANQDACKGQTVPLYFVMS